jgi:hypothetical protein
MKKLILVLPLIFAACATPPQTQEGYRETVHASRLMAKSEVNMKGTALATVKKRLEALAEECLRGPKKASCSTPDAECPGGTGIYTPTIDANDSQISMFLQQAWTDGVVTLQPTPQNGKYILLAEVSTNTDGSLKGVIYGPKLGNAKNLAEDTSKWILGQSTTCPQLP